MRIVIVGDNLTALAIATSLINDAHDITLIGEDKITLKHIEETLDIQTVQGSYTDTETFEIAESHEADIMIAATEIAATDMLVTLLAANLYEIPLTVTLLQESLYQNRELLLKTSVSHTQHIWISPTQVVSDYISNLITYPHCQEVILIEPDVCVARVRIEKGDANAQKNWLIQCQNTESRAKIIAVIRDGKHIAHCEHLQSGDQVIFCCPIKQVNDLTSELNSKKVISRVIIAGISAISKAVTMKISNQCKVKIIEESLEEASNFAQKVENVTILEGDMNDTDLLISEKIDQTDAFFALSTDDENNLVASLQAKRHQVPIIASLVHRPELAPIIEENDIFSIDPQKMLINLIFRVIHQDKLTQKHSLHQNAGEIICCKIPKHLHDSSIAKLHLPKNAEICVHIRDGKTMTTKTPLKQNDNLAIYLKDPNDVQKIIERLSIPETSLFDFLTLKKKKRADKS